jgi:hypothetical protein
MKRTKSNDQEITSIIMSSISYPTQILCQIERLFKSLDEGSVAPSSEEDYSALILSCGISDSLTLRKYEGLKLVDLNDDISQDEPVEIDNSQQEVDTAWEAFDSTWEHDVTSSRSPTSKMRSGVRRGRQDSVDTCTVATLTVITKTHDGSCRQRGSPSFNENDNASSVSSFNTESAA